MEELRFAMNHKKTLSPRLVYSFNILEEIVDLVVLVGKSY